MLLDLQSFVASNGPRLGGNVARDLARDCTIIIPTLNEVDSIGVLLTRLLSLYPGVRILVVDDGSDDGTIAAVRSFQASSIPRSSVEIIVRSEKKGTGENFRSANGITGSVIQGILTCTTSYFIVMDADLEHPPEKVSELLEQIGRGVNLAVSYRTPLAENRSPARFLISWSALVVARAFLVSRGVRLRDPLSGFFGGQVAFAQCVISENPNRFELTGYKVLFELLKNAKQKISLAEIPYKFGRREFGSSKLEPYHALMFFRSLVR